MEIIVGRPIHKTTAVEDACMNDAQSYDFNDDWVAKDWANRAYKGRKTVYNTSPITIADD